MSPKRILPTVLLGGALLASAGCDAVLGLFVPGYDGPHPRREGLDDERVVVRVVYGKSEAPAELAVFYADRVSLADRPRDVNRLAYVETREFLPVLATDQVRVGDTLRVTTEYVGVYFVGYERDQVPGWEPVLDGFEGTFPIARQKLLRIEKVGSPR